jgi:hypothetical protein
MLKLSKGAALLVLAGCLSAGTINASYLHVKPVFPGKDSEWNKHHTHVDKKDHGWKKPAGHDRGKWWDRSAGRKAWWSDVAGWSCRYNPTDGLVYQDVQMVLDETHFTDSIFIKDDGRYRVTLTDFRFPELFPSLGLSIATNTELLGSIEGPGSFEFDAERGRYFLSLFAQTDGEREYGQYGIKLIALDNVIPAAVPVPSSLSMLGTGLIVMARVARRRNGVMRKRG